MIFFALAAVKLVGQHPNTMIYPSYNTPFFHFPTISGGWGSTLCLLEGDSTVFFVPVAVECMG